MAEVILDSGDLAPSRNESQRKVCSDCTKAGLPPIQAEVCPSCLKCTDIHCQCGIQAL